MPFLTRSGSVTIDDNRFSYWEAGSGKPVMMLHGNPGTKNDFKFLAEKLSGSGWRCIAIDRPGHGNSEEALGDAPDPWLDATLLAQAARKLAGGPTLWIGYSLGAFTCLKVALKDPEVVNGLGLISPFIQPRDPNESPSAIPGMAKGYFLRSFFGIVMPFLAQSKLRQHLQRVWEPAEIPSLTLEDELRQYTVFETLLATMNDKNDLLKLLKEVQGKLDAISCPVLAVTGDKDAVCDSTEQLRILSEKIPRAKSVKIAAGGHGLPFTHADQVFQSLIQEFGPGKA